MDPAANEWPGEGAIHPTPGTVPRVLDATTWDEPASRATRGWRASVPAWLERWHRESLWLSVGVSVVAGAADAVHLGDRLHYADEYQYVDIAANLARHARFSLDGVHPTAYRAPGWPLLLAPIRFLGGGIVAYRLVNVALFALAVVLGWWLAREMGGKAVAALAAPMLALYPIAVYTEGTLYPETLGSVLVLAGIAAGVRARAAPGPLSWWAVGSGAAFGYLILTIPNAWLPLAAVLVWLALGRRRLWRTACCVLLVAVAVVSVWVVRNAITFHQFIPVTDASGYDLLLTDSEHAAVRSATNTDISLYTAAAADQGITSETALQSFYRSEAVDWIRSHPGRALQLYGERVANYFAPYDELATTSQQSLVQEVGGIVCYLPLLVLLAVRLVRWRSDPPGSLECLLIWIYLLEALVAAVFQTRIRYRVPFDDLLILVAASSLVSLVVGRPRGRHSVGRAHDDAPVPADSPS